MSTDVDTKSEELDAPVSNPFF